MKLFLRQVIIMTIIISYTLHISGQTPTPVYYTPVKMPSTLQKNFYGQFDTRLLAEDLSSLLQTATGRSFQPTPMTPGTSKGIFLLLDSSSSYSSNETGILETNGKDIIRLKAKYTTGLSYAMYSWLEELGFRFYLPGSEWTIIPSLKNIFPGKAVNKTYRPYFRLRMFNASGGIFPVKGLDENSTNEKDWQLWYRRNRMGCDYISIDGHIGEYFNIVHKKEIEADPTILAPVNGKRQYYEEGKIDPTNKKAVALFSDWIVEEAKKYWDRMPAFLPFKKYYTVDPGDGLNYCHTPECESRFRSVSDQVFSIANETASKIKQADARAGVSLLAYTERADTPSIRIAANVHVMVTASAFQSVSSSTELMQRWAKKTKNLSQYDFLNIGVWSYDAPFFDLYQYSHHLQFVKSLGIDGFNFESSLSKFASGIQQYFILKFLCSPYTSIEKVLDEFCLNNFGKAAPPMKKLLKEWYFSDTHLGTGYDKESFREDELGRFIQYIMDAENTNGISDAAKQRIQELKAYTVYLCGFYELFNCFENLKAYAADPSLRAAKAEELLTFTWQMYNSKIFHNTQLNDLLKQYLPESRRAVWDFRNSDHFRGITTNDAAIIQQRFEAIKKKYLPKATAYYAVTDDFLAANVKYSADSIHISMIDETAFGNYGYPLQFYAAGPGILKVAYRSGASQSKQKIADKAAIVAVERDDYSYIRNSFIKENSNGILIYNIPAKGHYKLYLSQYNATHIDYVIYPGRNLFYHDKQKMPMNGILMQDNTENGNYPNKYLAFIIPRTDSLYYSNLYWDSNNTIDLFSSSGKKIPVNSSRQPSLNAAAVPKNEPAGFIFFSNRVFRWPPILINTAACYLFLKYPLKLY